MKLENYKTVLYRHEGGSWVAEIPAISGCYALMSTREEALRELSGVFGMVAEEYAEKGIALPPDSTEIVNANATARDFQRVAQRLGFRRMRDTGSHERWNHPDWRSVTIPLQGRREIGPPLFLEINRQLPIEIDKFQKLR